MIDMEDPVIKTVLQTVDLFKAGAVEQMYERDESFIRLDVLSVMIAVLLNGIIKGGEKNLKSKRERDAFLHIHKECKKTLSVIFTACKEYATKYGTNAVPGVVISKAIEETVTQINNQLIS